ncbi:PREDICTED: ankyrin, partial [Prunus dulcis]
MATSAVSAGTIVVEVLNNSNYLDWSVYLRNYLLAQDLWDAVKAIDEPPEDEEKKADDPLKAWRKKNAMALHTIQISCGPEAFALIRDSNSAKFAWDALAANFKTQALLPSDLPVESATSSNNPGYDESVCDFRQYQPFFKAVRSGDWNKAKELLTLHPNAARAKIPYSNKTALYIATELEHEHIVEELVQLMLEEDLEIKSSGWTALAVAADRGNIKIVKCMVRKSKKILSIATENNNMTPILLACISEHWDVVRYLYSVTPLEDLMPDKGPYGAGLVCHSIGVKKFDIAQELINRCPKLVLTKDPFGISPMHALAFLPSIFPRINRIREMKLIHIQSLQILDHMCEVMTHLDGKEMEDVHEAIFRAVERGIFEFFDRIFQASPNLVWSYNRMRRNAFQFAIECRQEKVYTLIYKLDKRKRSSIANLVDTSKNGMLHVAGMLSPLAKLDNISGAALQMQRELQWFKEVETIVLPRMRDILNNENLTPRALFTKNHKELVKEGERWMKETATSCTVV